MVIEVKIVNAFVGVGVVVAKTRRMMWLYRCVLSSCLLNTCALYHMLYFNEKVHQKTSFHTKHFPIWQSSIDKLESLN